MTKSVDLVHLSVKHKEKSLRRTLYPGRHKEVHSCLLQIPASLSTAPSCKLNKHQRRLRSYPKISGRIFYLQPEGSNGEGNRNHIVRQPLPLQESGKKALAFASEAVARLTHPPLDSMVSRS